MRAPVEHRLGLTQSDVEDDQQHEGKVTPKVESHCFSEPLGSHSFPETVTVPLLYGRYHTQLMQEEES